MIPLKAVNGRKPLLRHCYVAAALLPVFIAVHLAAYSLRFEGYLSPRIWLTFWSTAIWAVSIKLLVFGFFHVYQGWTRYVTFEDLVILIRASIVSSLLLVLADYLFGTYWSTPRSVFLMDFGLTVVVVGSLRSASRFLREHATPELLRSGSRTPVLIVGANDSGEAILRSIRRNANLSYRVVGFIAEDRKAVRSHIAGVPVIGILDETCQLAQQYQIPEVLITAGELTGQQVRKLVDEGRETGVSVRVLPSYEQLLRGSVDLRPRQVSIEDLLRREPVQLDMRQMHEWVADRVLLVTGSAGSIGSEICRQLLQFSPRRLVVLDRSENGQFFLERDLRQLPCDTEIEICIADINDAIRMNQVFRKYEPDIVFHAAAYKHVPLMEMHPGEAVKNIALASAMLADLAHQHGTTSFVMVSTDKAVNPTSVMGTCKRVAELYVQSLAQKSDCRFVTVRFGNVLDSAGSVVPIFRSQIAAGGPVTVTHPEMKRFFMTISEASQLVIQAGAMGSGSEIFVLHMGEPEKIVDLARDMIRLSGLELGRDIEIEFTGVRPGEKLYEELHCDGETHSRTSHPKIMIAEANVVGLSRVRDAISHLRQVCDGDPREILEALQSAVVQYHPEPVAERRAA